jgi:hypothetical protein
MVSLHGSENLASLPAQRGPSSRPMHILALSRATMPMVRRSEQPKAIFPCLLGLLAIARSPQPAETIVAFQGTFHQGAS